MAGVDVGRFDRHGAIEKNREWPDFLFAEHPREQTREQLRAANRKSGHEDFAALGDGVLNNAHEFRDGFGEGPMIAVAVSGFQEKQVGLFKWFKILEDECALGTEIAGENDAPLNSILLHDQLNAGRAEHVAGLGPNGLDAWRDLHGL